MQPIKPASTVVVLKESPLSVLMLKRPKNSRFMGGYYVFPGGKVDEADHANENPFAHAACRETKEEVGISIEPHELFLIGWWITPAIEERRYDTRFFCAFVPEKADVRVEASTEWDDCQWFTVQKALTLWREEKIDLAPPTLATLELLAGCKTRQDVEQFPFVIDRPICPIAHAKAERLVLALPGDHLHDDPKTALASGRTRFESHSSPLTNKLRFV